MWTPAQAPTESSATLTVPYSAVIASHNEARLLGDRLVELSFCDEVIVIDIASSDETRSVAAAAGARMVPWPYTEIAENARPAIVCDAHHELLVICDPDEEIPASLARQVAELPATLADDVGIVVVPLIYYFGGRPLRGTIWGGVSRKQLVVRRGGVEFVPAAHRPYRLLPGFRRIELPYDGENAIHHHWVSGYREFISKHLRYVRIEGRDRALAGEITGFRALARTPWSAFRTSFITQKGHRDGFRGLLLSVLYSAYRTASDVQLIRELRRAP